MEAIKSLSYHLIKDGLLYGVSSVKENILNPLKIDRDSMSLRDLVSIMSDDLKSKNFDYDSTNILYDDARKHSIPGLIDLYTYDRKDGGIVRINKDYKISNQLEAFFHEYAHIKDDSLPILPKDINAVNRKALYNNNYLRNIEFSVDMIAHTLMIPPANLTKDLLNSRYDINNVLDIYKVYDRGSVLWWLTLNVRYPCHFAWIMFERDKMGNTKIKKICDSCTFDHYSDPKPFDIETVLKHKESAASIAVELKKPECVQKISEIYGMEYYCYAYYETDMPKEMVCEMIPDYNSSIDRLLVFGWPKNYYDLIQYTWNSKK